MRLILLIILVLSCQAVVAELYKWTKNGEVIYSDKPNPNGPSEKVKGAPLTTYKPSAAVRKALSPQTKAAEPEKRILYTAFTVSQPENDAAIRDNAGNVTVKFTATPPLSNLRGHRIDVYLDGKKAGSTGGNSYKFNNMDRGTHTVQGKIVDGAGKVLKSASVTFHLKRFSSR